jgi:hypothetical protein
MDVKFDKPPVHFTTGGVPYVDAVDILLSRVGQEEISKMAALEVSKTNHNTPPAEPAKP